MKGEFSFNCLTWGSRMELQEIDVVIDRNGNVQIEVRGVKGPGCLALTRDLEAALGNAVAHRQMTPEATELPGTVPVQQHVAGGGS